MNVVDSSARLECFANGSNASFFTPPIEDLERWIVPSVTIYEVFKRGLQQREEGQALQAVATVQQGTVVKLDERLAISAARIGVDLKIPLADRVVLATARAHSATVWTQDEDFRDLPNVQYRRRKA